MRMVSQIWHFGWHYIMVLFCVCCAGLVSCQSEIVSDDPSLRLSFSHDSILFDTVFTALGSSTKQMMIYNPNRNAILIDRVEMREGTSFFINLDGENQIENMCDITLRGGDSLFLFVRTKIDPQSANSPVLVEDTIVFYLNQTKQEIHLQAYGQNVEILRGDNGLLQFDKLSLTNEKPYLIYDTLLVTGNLSIQQGSTLYMHSGAMIYAYGNVIAKGTLENPITIRGDRTDRLFDSVPYRVASGQWGGIFLVDAESILPPRYEFDYVDIISGSVGLYAISENSVRRPKMSLTNSRIHNHAEYGLVLQNIDATVANTEISNCASHCVYLAGGYHNFVHNTIAAFYGFPFTTINIHNNMLPEDVAAVYINNLSKNSAPTISSFYNCIIAGARKNNLVLATPLPDYYEGHFIGNYMRADSLDSAFARDNVYASDSDSVVFRNTYYLSREYRYYDFNLDSLSPARSIADSTSAIPYPLDRLGNRRKKHPDAGCYEYIEAAK